MENKQPANAVYASGGLDINEQIYIVFHYLDNKIQCHIRIGEQLILELNFQELI